MENSKMNNNEIINKLVDYINFIIKLTDDMCDYIYKGESNRIFDDLNKFINGLDFILSKSSYISDDINIKELDIILINMEKAMSIKDYVLFTDILLYELKPMFQKWIELLEMKYENK